jgi:adenylate cyclase
VDAARPVGRPDNNLIRYNFACALVAHLGDPDAGLAMLAPILEHDPAFCLEDAKIDPDLETLRADPRFQAMLAAAQAKLAAAQARLHASAKPA